MKLKKIIKEHSLGILPSSKLIKMKWNPLTESEPINENEAQLKSGLEKVIDDSTKKKLMQTTINKLVDDILNFLKKNKKI